MTVMTLYTGGGVSLSPVPGEGRIESEYVRLVADEGMVVSDGETFTECIDIRSSDVSKWSETDPPDPDPDVDDAEAFQYLFGGDGE